MREEARSADEVLQVDWFLRFPAALESRFRDYFVLRSLPVVRFTVPLLLLFYLTAVMFEYSHLPALVRHYWLPHLVIFLVLTQIAVVAWVKPSYLQLAIILGLLVSGFCADWLALDSGSEFSHFYFQVSMLMVLLTTLLRVMLIWALPLMLLIIAMQAGSLIYGNFALGIVQLRLLVIVLVALVSIVSLYFTERLLRQHFLIERSLRRQQRKLSHANQALTHESREDPLTHVLNRRGMEQSLGGLLGRMQQRAPGAPQVLSLLLFDIDFFKQFNDGYGHLAGDACLQQVAATARRLMTGVDGFVARYGGEEFVLVLVGRTQDAGMAFAEQLRAEVQSLGIEHKGSKVAKEVTISIGVSSYAMPTETEAAAMDAASLIHLADQGLYQAKHLGRNRVELLS